MEVVRARFTWKQDPQELDVEAWTVGVADRIYPVRNRYRTTVDADGLPKEYSRQIAEGGFQAKLLARYNQAKRTVQYWRDSRSSSWTQTLPGPVHTLFSAMEQVRIHDFDVQPTLMLLVDADGTYWQTTAHRTRRLRVDADVIWEVRFRFEQVATADNERRMPGRSDLLTANIVREGSQLVFWIRPGLADREATIVRMDYRTAGFHLIASPVE